MPTCREFYAYTHSVLLKYYCLLDVYAEADGLNLCLEQSGDAVFQGLLCNEWKFDHFVTNAFVFSPAGTVIACTYNCPGSFHDSTVADWGEGYDRLDVFHGKYSDRIVVSSIF